MKSCKNVCFYTWVGKMKMILKIKKGISLCTSLSHLCCVMLFNYVHKDQILEKKTFFSQCPYCRCGCQNLSLLIVFCVRSCYTLYKKIMSTFGLVRELARMDSALCSDSYSISWSIEDFPKAGLEIRSFAQNRSY